LPLGLIASSDKALAEIQICFVFIVLASGLPYDQRMTDLLGFFFSWCCASGRCKLRAFNGKPLRTHPVAAPTLWVAAGNPPVASC
jgi:hypothetical protein